ncbi:MAG: hypothetical protein ABSG25_02335 [Bryobacteraceae bacterium]
MGQIIILKDVNKTTVNLHNTVRITVSNFSYSDQGSFLVRQNQGIVATYIGWLGQQGDQYSESLSSTWEPIFDGGGAVDKINKLMIIAGIGSLKTKAMYSQVWTDSKPATFSIPMTFIADQDPIKEVMLPVRGLQRMIVPVEQNAADAKKTTDAINQIARKIGVPDGIIGIVDAAKQTIFDQVLLPPAGSVVNLKQMTTNTMQGIDSIEIGKFVILRDVVITDVAATFNVDDSDYGGVPKSANVTLTVQSKNIWTDKTIQNLGSGTHSDVIDPIEIINLGNITKKIEDDIKGIFGGT